MQLAEPCVSLFLAHGFHAADQSLIHRREADETEDVAFQRLDAVGPVEVPVDHRRHAHGDHDPRRAAGQPLPAEGVALHVLEGEAGAQHLLQKSLHQRRHVAKPEREAQYQVLAPGDGRLCVCQRVGQRVRFPCLLAAQQRNVEGGELDHAHLVALGLCPLAIVIGQRMAEVWFAGVRVALQDQDSMAHGG